MLDSRCARAGSVSLLSQIHVRPACVASLFLGMLGVMPVHAQGVVYPAFPSCGSSVVVRFGNTLLVGGASALFASLGAGLSFDTTTGAPDADFPRIDGTVHTVAADGAGGWYIGGDFRAVGGVLRRNLAHILADHSVAAWAPEADGPVRTLVLAQGAVYVGGEFAEVGEAIRPRLAQLDAETGLATTWSPSPDDVVRRLAREGGTLYAVGNFTSIGGVGRNGLAAIELSTGAVSGWDPQADGAVSGIDPAGGLVYLSGSFLNVGGQPRAHVACVDAATALPTAWAPSVNGDVSGIAVSDTRAYLFGDFFVFLAGQFAGGLVEFDLGTAQPTRRLPFVQFDVPVVMDQMEVEGGLLRVAGALAASGLSVSGTFTTHLGLVTVDLASGLLTDWAPPAKGFSHAFATAGNRLFVGGDRHLIRSNERDFGHLAAIDIETGAGIGLNLKLWGDPYLDFEGNLKYFPGLVRALAVSGTTLYIGGRFSRFEGPDGEITVRRNLAAVDLATGQLLAWDPDATGPPTSCVGDGAGIASIALHGNTVLVGGRFEHVGGHARNCLAALDAVSGVASDWNPAPDDSVSCILSSGDVVFVAGSFSHIGGVPRSGLAALDVSARDSTDGITTAWDPAPRPEPTHGWINGFCVTTGPRFAPVRTMAFHGPTLIVGGSFTRFGGDLGPQRAGLAALDTTSGTVTPWAPSVSGSVAKVVVDGPMAYVAGDFQQVEGQPRNGIAAVSLATGVPDPWNPNDRPVDPRSSFRRFDILVDGGTAFVSGSFEDFGPYPQMGLAAMRDIDAPTVLVLESIQEEPRQLSLVWLAGDSRRRQAVVYRRVGGGSWESRGFIHTGEDDRLRYVDTEVVPGESYGYQLGVTRPGVEEFFGEANVTVAVTDRPLFALRPLRPNPAHAAMVVEFTLPDAQPARLDLVDVTGRLIASHAVGRFGAGPHLVDLGVGVQVPPGLYFVSLERAGERLVRRVAVIP